MPVFEGLGERVKKLGETVWKLVDKNLGQEPKMDKWRVLPNEIQQNILAHAIADQDSAWEANQAFVNLSVTSKSMHAKLHEPKAMQDFKSNLDTGREAAKTVLKDAFPDGKFSRNPIGWGQLTVEHETDALVPVLGSCSPMERLGILKGISKLPAPERFAGYARIVQEADLLPQKKIDDIVLDAAKIFKHEDSSDPLTMRAAVVMAFGYDAASAGVKERVMKSVRGANAHRRSAFAELVAQTGQFKHEEFKTLVREEHQAFESPHRALVALASHIDKHDRAEADFIVDRSFRLFGGNFPDDEHDKYAAIAIATVADGNISFENKLRIRAFLESDSEGAPELKLALEEQKSAESSRDTARHGSQQPRNLAQPGPHEMTDKLISYQNKTSGPHYRNTVSQIDQAQDTKLLAETTENHVNAARRALMQTERQPRER